MPSAPARTSTTRTKGDRERFRRSILDAARRLVERGGGDVTTQDLIKEAGVALQAFYRHFGGTDQLLLALIGSQVKEYSAHWRLHQVWQFSLAAIGSSPAAPPRRGARKRRRP